ncbi:hypothetical protein BaRGS_00012840 [Batillaria attramentaria]|uniref:thiopurine S-methyltransferase n=1 Tax=Batillaria attramentaria TaxID=370345 RepID=A0ABD0L9H9_9CAEN
MADDNVDPRFTVMQPDDWVTEWNDGKIGFHKTCIHPLLEKNLDKMIDGRENIKIFFPLCGKALDMKWLADKGHTVVGVEAAQQGIEEFFTEQGVTYTTEDAPACNGKLFQSEDTKLRIYCCDFYSFSRDVEGQFDGVWDRGALVAINRQDHRKYTGIIKTLMAPGCRQLLSTVIYDETKYNGPPHYVSDEQVRKLYGDTCSVEQLCEEDAFEEEHKEWNLSALSERIYLIKPK